MPTARHLSTAVFDDARGQCNDRGMAPGEILAPANFDGRLEPVHLGHLAIHEDQAVFAARMAIERAQPVLRGLDSAAHAFEDGDTDFQVDGAVFDQKDRRPACARLIRRRRSAAQR